MRVVALNLTEQILAPDTVQPARPRGAYKTPRILVIEVDFSLVSHNYIMRHNYSATAAGVSNFLDSQVTQQ